MTEASIVHANEIIASLSEDFAQKCISSTVVSITIVIVDDSLPVLKKTGVSVIS